MTGFEIPSANPKGSALRPFSNTGRTGLVIILTRVTPWALTCFRMSVSQVEGLTP